MAKKEKAKFKEFKVTGKIFEYSGRIYPGKDGKGHVKREWGMSICLNNAFTLKGCWLTQTTRGITFISFPQYKSGDSYESYIYSSEELRDDWKVVVSKLCEIVGVESPKDDDIAEAPEGDLPF